MYRFHVSAITCIYGGLYDLRVSILQRYTVVVSLYSAGSVVPNTCYCACEIAWHRLKQPAVAAFVVVPLAAIVRAFPSIVHISALQA